MTVAQIMKLFRQANILPIVVVLVAFFLADCSGKKRKRQELNLPGTEKPVDPVVVPPATTSPVVGEDVPPVEADKITVLETTDKLAIKHLIFKTTDAREDFRYKSEYLLVVRAAEKSCVKLKVRPTDGIESGVPTDEAAEAEKLKNCDENENIQAPPEAKPEEIKPEEAKKTTSLLEPIYAQRKSRGFQLASSSELCSRRLFRMIADPAASIGEPGGIEKVVAKTARLVKISAGGKVRVWLDEEFGNSCRGGTSPTDLNRYGFGYINQLTGSSFQDKLYLSHMENLASSMEEALAKFTSLYGEISDVDGSGTVELFLSPDINRKYFAKQRTSVIDHIEANLINKPEDLAHYNAASNPSSNEGEVIYMWTPDAGGIYNYAIFPSSNSVASNYAKGYGAAQIMNLIIHNQHLIVKKSVKEEDFLRESLAFLASQYHAGIDFNKWDLANYLTSWPQGLSLTDGAAKEIIGESYQYSGNEINGLRAMFGWYLHTKLCSRDSVEPCAALKDLIATDKVGIANVEAILGEKFNDILEHFGASVGISLLDYPSAAQALWDGGDYAKTSKKPLILPDLTEVNTATPPQTIEEIDDASSIVSDKTDRTKAGPFPSKEMLLFQPILPDEELSLALAKNSVTYILLTGLIDSSTDMTAVLGKGLNVQIVPAGERDSVIRRLHKEKLSEAGHLDFRPENLTNQIDAKRTYYAEPEYDSSQDYTVNSKREVWILGSIDKYSVNVENTQTGVGDADSYNLKIDPCQDLAGAELTACQGKTFQVLVQAHIRDLPKKIAPMMFTTTTNLNIFRGSTIWSLITRINPDFKLDEKDPLKIGVFCQSELSWTDNPSPAPEENKRCANGGLTAPTYATAVCSAYAANGACLDGNLDQAATFDFYNSLTSTGFQATYDNFFHSALGFPFYNYYSIFYEDSFEDIYSDERIFITEEANRQFFSFSYNGKLEPYKFYFYTLDKDSSFPTGASVVSSEDLSSLLDIKYYIDHPPTPVSDTFVTKCTGLGFTEVNCRALNTSLDAEVISWIATKKKVIVCEDTCPGEPLTIVGTGTTPHKSSQWFTPGTNYLQYTKARANAGSGPDQTFLKTYYKPSAPEAMTGVCSGNPDPAFTGFSYCGVDKDFLSENNDIRRQFNIPTSRFEFSGCGEFGKDFDICADPVSWEFETGDKKPLASWYSQKLSTDRTRVRSGFIYTRGGELVDKPERIQATMIQVSGAAPTTIHVLIGGRKMSQGKYMLRARIFPTDQ